MNRLQFLDIDDGERVVEQSVLEAAVDGGVGGHGGTAVDFDEPGLEVGVEHDVEAVELEAPLVVGYDLAGGNQRLDYELLDIEVAFVSCLLAVLRQDVQSQLIQQVFSAPLLVVVLALLLDGHVGEVHL